MKSAAKPARPRGRPRSFDRDRALQRALDVFWDKGYETASVSDLTQAMGINPPSLYAAFGDKEKLFLEALDRYYETRSESLACAYQEEPTAREAIRRILMEFADQLATDGHHRGCMVVMATTTCADASPHLKAKLAQARATSRSRFKARLDRALAEGELPEGTNTGTLADFYTTVFQGMSVHAREGASRKSLMATAEMAMRAWPESKSKHERSVGSRKAQPVV